MMCAGDEDDPFPVDDCLFAETFSQDTVYSLVGEELKIRQVFGANLGVAAPVWEAVRLHVDGYENIPDKSEFCLTISVCVCVHRRYTCAVTSRSSRCS